MQGTQILNQAVACQPQRTATLYRDRRRTWQQVGQRVPRMASALRALGIGPGDFVAVLAMNSDNYIELFFAVPWAGGVLAPMNIRWSTAENVYALTDSRASVLFVDESFVDQARELRRQLPHLATLIYMGDGQTPDDMLSFEHLIENAVPVEDAHRCDEDLFVVFYTGGTTAHPKGVAMSHRALVHGTLIYLAMLPDIEDLSFLYVGGYFHFAGASPLLYITLAGGTHVILPKFEPLSVMRAISQHRVTNATLVPTMINLLLQHREVDRHDLSSVRTCIYGGSPMPEALMTQAIERLPGWRFYQIYGMTETGGFATMLRWRDHVPTGPKAARYRSAGQPAPGVEVRILLPDASTAPPGQFGEIVMRSGAMMTGYLNNPRGTAEVLKDGWMHSGDAGLIDEDGYLFVLDRVKDMVVTGGENVYSIEVERALFQHPGVQEAAVIGIPSAQWGESVHAVVVLRPGASVTAEELMAHCRSLIGGYKCPRSIEFRDEALPVTPVGKVRKNVLRDPYWVDRTMRIA